MMKKKAMKREYTTPQCTILSEELPCLQTVSKQVPVDDTYPDGDDGDETEGGW